MDWYVIDGRSPRRQADGPYTTDLDAIQAAVRLNWFVYQHADYKRWDRIKAGDVNAQRQGLDAVCKGPFQAVPADRLGSHPNPHEDGSVLLVNGAR